MCVNEGWSTRKEVIERHVCLFRTPPGLVLRLEGIQRVVVKRAEASGAACASRIEWVSVCDSF